MKWHGLFLVAVILFLHSSVGEAQVKALLIDCGSNSSTHVDGRKWIGDTSPIENFTLSYPGIVASVAVVDGEPAYGSLYQTARFFDAPSTYNISVFPRTYFVRLHFFPFSFESFNANESAFDVSANGLKLLSAFNVPGEISWKNTKNSSNYSSLVKEYFVNVSSNQLAIIFVPKLGSFAFVNAIEIVSVIDQLFVDSVSKVGGNGLKANLNLDDWGMETMFRLNVGVPAVESSEDQDMWRKWESDEGYMFSVNAATTLSNTSSISYSNNGSFVAPLLVYETARTMTNNEVLEKHFNMSWKFDVDPNFDYLIRLHFCELIYDKPNQRLFKIYINNKTAAENYDVFVRAGGMNKAYHEDYVDSISQQTNTLWVQLGPDLLTSSSTTDALLNGMEIFKLSRNGNLAHATDRITIDQGGSTASPPKSKILWVIIGSGILSVIILSLVGAFIFCLYIRKKKAAVPAKETPPGWLPLSLHGAMGSTTNAQAYKSPSCVNGSLANRTGRRFTIAEIRSATNNFDDSLVIGTGGFGKVYKGETEEGTPVAIKRANPQSEQGLAEFETEIEMLSKLRHRHLVSMIGYCDEQNEMILVYEYMANGTLRSHLFGSVLPPLTWKQRLEACIGAARGLHYLHTGVERCIIHRDVKTTNILLDENFVAKMSDFGLSKTGPGLDHTHVSTAVKGSFGYLDPEYFRRQQLTQKSDVYSFGVVLFEVVCARSVINPTLPKDQINLAEWAIRWQRQHSLETIMDPHLEGSYSLESFKKFGEIAEKCLADEGKNRPTMGEVLWHLEYTLQLHEAYTENLSIESLSKSEVRFADMAISLPLVKEGEEASPDISRSN
ncbi:hypothetical protein J5N97_028304 [Dioscorea zingiberensis]|uniref:Protein kinase domain-containing protein n=1 Tax=Dioscorea zingiberensis TaxID=325984 RepID=A0A9D5H4R5_9LILI|nr:hypothetical protein J5N97_028304 [Dioscorea zingiberensis]